MDALQDHFPDAVARCYGCGRLNERGLHIRTVWDGDETVTWFTPEPHHTAYPGIVYGGTVASLIDCHGAGTATAAAYREAGRPLGSEPLLNYVTARLAVDFVKPTPLGVPLELRGRVTEMKGRKVVVAVSLRAEGTERARGEVVCVQLR